MKRKAQLIGLAAKRPNSRPCRGLHKEGRGGFVWITGDMEHEIWLTRLFNDYLPGPANTFRSWVGLTPDNPARPGRIFVVMQVLVAAVIVGGFRHFAAAALDE